MIVSFADHDTERLLQKQRVKRPNPRLHRKTLIRLWLLDVVHELDELRVPPGNRLGALKGARIGQHNIRINDQWRVCFAWIPTGPSKIEIVDYH